MGNSVGDTINGFVDEFEWDTLGTTISDGIDSAVDFAKGIIETTEWNDLGESVGYTIGKAISTINWYNIGLMIVEGFGSIKDLASGIGDGIISGILDGIIETAEEDETKQTLWKVLKEVFITWIKSKFKIHSPSTVTNEEIGQPLGEGIIEGIKEGLSNIGETVYTKFQEAKDVIQQKIEDIQGTVSTKFEDIKTTISDKISTAKETVTTKFEDIKTTISDKVGTAKTTVSTKFGDIKTAISDKVSSAKTTVSTKFEDIKTTISNKLGDVVEDAKDWGKDLISNFISGITSKISSLRTTLSNVASTVADWIGFSEPEEGPLSNFHTYAPDMLDLFATGIHDNIDTVTSELEGLTTEISYTLNTDSLPNMSDIATYSSVEVSNNQSTMEDVFDKVLSKYVDTNNQSINLSVYVSDKKLGQILLDDLRSAKRRSGKDIEALVGN